MDPLSPRGEPGGARRQVRSEMNGVEAGPRASFPLSNMFPEGKACVIPARGLQRRLCFANHPALTVLTTGTFSPKHTVIQLEWSATPLRISGEHRRMELILCVIGLRPSSGLCPRCPDPRLRASWSSRSRRATRSSTIRCTTVQYMRRAGDEVYL